MKNPEDPEEWQEAVNAAYLMRAIANAAMYGFVTWSGGRIDVGRCDYLIDEGAKRGYMPNKSIEELLHDAHAAAEADHA